MGRGCWEQPYPSTSRPLTDAHSSTSETWSPQAQTSLTSSVTMNCAPWRTSYLMQPAGQGACPTILVSGASGLHNLDHRGEAGCPNILVNGHPTWLILSNGALSLLQHLSEQSQPLSSPASSKGERQTFPPPQQQSAQSAPTPLCEEWLLALPP